MTAPNVQNIHLGQLEIFVGGTPPAAGVDLTDPTTSALNSMASLFANPTSGGVYVGFTNGAATLAYKPTYYMVETEQAFAEVAVVPTGEEGTLDFTALEVTYANIARAYGQGTTHVVAGPPAVNAVHVGGKASVSTSLFVGYSRKHSGVGYYIASLYQGYSFNGGSLPFLRREDTKIPVQVRCLADTTRPVGDQLFQIAEYPANPA
jgi:hypothetical protein